MDVETDIKKLAGEIRNRKKCILMREHAHWSPAPPHKTDWTMIKFDPNKNNNKSITGVGWGLTFRRLRPGGFVCHLSNRSLGCGMLTWNVGCVRMKRICTFGLELVIFPTTNSNVWFRMSIWSTATTTSLSIMTPGIHKDHAWAKSKFVSGSRMQINNPNQD